MAAVARVFRHYVGLLLRAPRLVGTMTRKQKKTAALVLGSLLYTLRSSLYVAALRGKWASMLWSWALRKKQTRQQHRE